MIESLHWLRDVVFSEDECRFSSDNAHLTLNSFRKYALALHKSYMATLPKKGTIFYLFSRRHLLFSKKYPPA